jgi:DNA-binding CsgD family transcriptional regulator
MPQRREHGLTALELGVLIAAGHGLTVAETAAKRSCSLETIKSHRKSVLRKLDARNMTHAVAIAFNRGIFDADGRG